MQRQIFATHLCESWPQDTSLLFGTPSFFTTKTTKNARLLTFSLKLVKILSFKRISEYSNSLHQKPLALCPSLVKIAQSNRKISFKMLFWLVSQNVLSTDCSNFIMSHQAIFNISLQYSHELMKKLNYQIYFKITNKNQ